MTLSFIATTGAMVFVYVLVTALIAAMRVGQIKDIHNDPNRTIAFSRERCIRSVLITESAWGVGFILVTIMAYAFASRIGTSYGPVEVITLVLMIAMLVLVLWRIVRAFMVAFGGRESLMKRFSSYRRAHGLQDTATDDVPSMGLVPKHY